MSLDGYIADSNGKVDFLNGHGIAEENVDTYSYFIRDVDTVIMGCSTYHHVTTELSPDEWVYRGLTTYVLTHRRLSSAENIKFVQDNPCSVVEKLKSEEGKSVWICGGASIIHLFMQGGLIDEYYISIILTNLGSGIRLFEESKNEIKLKLVSTQSYNGITELFYQTVHAVNAKDYTKEQLDLWASGCVDLEKWDRSFLSL